MPQPYATEADAREAYAKATGSAVKLRAVMSGAAGMVQRIAPVQDAMEGDPPTEPTDYAALAADAELLAGAWLWETGGYIERSSVFEASAQYGSIGGLEVAIAGIMGDYATGANGQSQGSPAGALRDVVVGSSFTAPPPLAAFNVNDPYSDWSD